MLIQTEPKIAQVQIVRKLKQISTNQLWKSYNKILKKHFWKEKTFWSDGYFVCSVGNIRRR